jgi:hypothetical protein
MSCSNCRDFSNNTCTEISSSSCISWQGDKQEELEVCINDSLTHVGNVILGKLKDLLKGKSIILEDLTLDDAQYIKDILDTDEKNLLNVLNAYKLAIKGINDSVLTNTETINSFTELTAYTLDCLESVTIVDFKDLIQGIIDKVCSLDAQLEGIAQSILDVVEEGAGNFLVGGAVTSAGGNGVSVSGVGADAKVKFSALVPPYCPILFTGSTSSNFDNAGVGLPNTPYQGWYLCNGANGTPVSTTLPQNVGNNLKYIIRFN